MKYSGKFYFYSIFIFTISFLIQCEAEKEKDFYGIGEEDVGVLFTGLILNQGFQDTRDGNILDTANRVVYRKCVSGQVYRPEENDCRGIQRGSLFTPNDTVLYGASKLAYCSVNSSSCNSRDFPFALVSDAGLIIPGTSEAFQFCNSLNDANGSPGWRVATPIELTRLTLGGRNAMQVLFPDTPEDWFWSGWGRANDVEGVTALAVSFERSNLGEEKGFEKQGRKYVRCARNLP